MTRGLSNDNPANIRRTGQKWIGMRPVQLDKDFVQFSDICYGIRAFLIICRTYRRKHGIVTLESFVRRFAPATENNVESYIKFLRNHDVPEVFTCEYDYFRLAHAVFRYESRYNCPIYVIGQVHAIYKIRIIPSDVIQQAKNI